MSRPPAQKGAARPGARPLAWRVHDENPRQSGQFRRHHRVRSDRWPGCGHNPLRDPAQHRAGHHAARRARRQRLFQQGQSRRGANARYRPGDPSQGQREERTCLLRETLYKARARIEQGFGRLKRFKRVALRCEKTAQNSRSIVSFAAGLCLIKLVKSERPRRLLKQPLALLVDQLAALVERHRHNILHP